LSRPPAPPRLPPPSPPGSFGPAIRPSGWRPLPVALRAQRAWPVEGPAETSSFGRSAAADQVRCERPSPQSWSRCRGRSPSRRGVLRGSRAIAGTDGPQPARPHARLAARTDALLPLALPRSAPPRKAAGRRRGLRAAPPSGIADRYRSFSLRSAKLELPGGGDLGRFRNAVSLWSSSSDYCYLGKETCSYS
jgi:hypothetical protein